MDITVYNNKSNIPLIINNNNEYKTYLYLYTWGHFENYFSYYVSETTGHYFIIIYFTNY